MHTWHMVAGMISPTRDQSFLAHRQPEEEKEIQSPGKQLIHYRYYCRVCPKAERGKAVFFPFARLLEQTGRVVDQHEFMIEKHLRSTIFGPF